MAPSPAQASRARSHPGVADSRGPAPAAAIASISVPDVESAWDTQVLDGYVVLDSEVTADGATPARPDRLQDPDRSLGPHQAYAFQWWMTMPLGLLLIWLGLRRDLCGQPGGGGRRESVALLLGCRARGAGFRLYGCGCRTILRGKGVVRGGGLRGLELEALTDQQPGVQVDDAALHAAAAHIDTEPAALRAAVGAGIGGG